MTQGGCPRSSVLRDIADGPQSKKVKPVFRKEVENVVGDRADNGPRFPTSPRESFQELGEVERRGQKGEVPSLIRISV